MRYEQFGWDYRRWNPFDERAIEWSKRHAREADGPILELACGTGTLLGPLARDGHEMVGLDLCQAMLDIADEERRALPPEIRERITLIKGDMADFELGRTFALVILADNSFRELETRDAMLDCLHRVRRHLRPEGRCLVVERRFDPARFTDGAWESPWCEPYPNPATGDIVRRKVTVHFDEQTMRLDGVMDYEVTRPDGSVTHAELPFRAPALLTEDYLRLFDEAGLRARQLFDYDERRTTGDLLCFVAD